MGLFKKETPIREITGSYDLAEYIVTDNEGGDGKLPALLSAERDILSGIPKAKFAMILTFAAFMMANSANALQPRSEDTMEVAVEEIGKKGIIPDNSYSVDNGSETVISMLKRAEREDLLIRVNEEFGREKRIYENSLRLLGIISTDSTTGGIIIKKVELEDLKPMEQLIICECIKKNLDNNRNDLNIVTLLGESFLTGGNRKLIENKINELTDDIKDMITIFKKVQTNRIE